MTFPIPKTLAEWLCECGIPEEQFNPYTDAKYLLPTPPLAALIINGYVAYLLLLLLAKRAKEHDFLARLQALRLTNDLTPQVISDNWAQLCEALKRIPIDTKDNKAELQAGSLSFLFVENSRTI
jgi:hypothetical protein